MKFAELMKAERKTQRITLRELSEKTGIRFSKLADFDAGRAEPCLVDKDLICSALGVYFQDISLSETKPREYQKHEFCKAMNCSWFQHGICTLKPGCAYTARQLHHWLNDDGFKIAKVRKDRL